jgi:biopolymer transport protein ExbB
MSMLMQIVDTTANALVKPAGPEPQINLFDLVLKGGWVMIPLGLLSVGAIYFMIERFLTIQKASKVDPNFMHNIKDYLLSGKKDAALMLCKNTNTPIARLVEKGIKRIGRPYDEIERAVESEGKLEIYKLEKNMNYLALISGIAAIVGFLGTISGVINIFYKMSLTNDLSIDVIAGGMYEKMVTSGTGLLVGIIAHIGFTYLNGRIDRVSYQLEKTTVDFIDVLNEPG